jgi:signal transduction histidine kinase
MLAAPASTTPRRLLVGLLLFGLFVLFDIALFGWLIFRSLSQREIERVLLETRHQAEGLAAEIADRADRQGEDLYTAVALERETKTYLDSVLQHRDIVQTIEIRDRDGQVVFRGRSEATIPTQPGANLRLEARELPPQLERRTTERQSTYDLAVPIGDVGTLHIGISQQELAKRIGVLRGELIRQASAIALVTAALLLLAYLAIWWLWRRGRGLEEQAAEAERLAYVGTLASGLAHEIRNPLNSLNLNMQLLEENLGPGDPDGSRSRILALTRSEIGRLERLVTDFLSYARPRPLELTDVAPAELLESTRDVLAGQIQARGVRVSVEDRSQGVWVRVDREQMRQLLLNLTQNALVATEDSGRLPVVTLRATREGSRVALEVADNGVGIPPEEQERVFELFYSTRKGGTGLGLPIVRRIARAHQAELELTTEPGQGTMVRVLLAAVPPRPDEVPLPASLETSPRV